MGVDKKWPDRVWDNGIEEEERVNTVQKAIVDYSLWETKWLTFVSAQMCFFSPRGMVSR
jgi:hypothetical protein